MKNKVVIYLMIFSLLFNAFVIFIPIENVSGADWYNTGWQYSHRITINSSLVENTLTNFPVLIDYTNVNLSSAQADGDDFVFVSANNETKYNHEIEYFTQGESQIVAWVNVTTVSSSSDTIIYMYYGNASATNQQNKEGTWDSNFLYVYHMNSTTATVYDSTSNDDDATKESANNPSQADGFIKYGQDFEASDTEYMITSNTGFDVDSNDWTVELWCKFESTAGTQAVWQQRDGDGTGRTILEPTTSLWGTYFGGSWKSSTRAMETYWEYVCLQYDTAGDDCYWYFNGSYITSNLNVGGEDNDGDYVHGAFKSLTGGWFDGMQDEFRYSSIRRNNSYLRANYNNTANNNNFITVDDRIELSNQSPEITNFYPADDAIEISTSPNITFDISDADSDVMNVTIYSVNDSQTIKTWNNQADGSLYYKWWTKRANYTYHLLVNITDGHNNWNNYSFNFTTRETYLNDSAELWENGKIYYFNESISYNFSNSPFEFFEIGNSISNITIDGMNNTIEDTNGTTNSFNEFIDLNINNDNFTCRNFNIIGFEVVVEQTYGENILLENLNIYNVSFDYTSYHRVISFFDCVDVTIQDILIYNITNTHTNSYYHMIDLYYDIEPSEYYNLSNITIYNISAGQSSRGVVFSSPNNITLDDFEIYNLDDCIFGTGTTIYITNGTMYNSSTGINLSRYAKHMYIYNNYFNNTNNVVFNSDHSHLYFNTTMQLGTRIYSNGLYIGGNYWALPNGSGYSQIGTDANNDGFIDNPYNVGGSGFFDYLPYSDNYASPEPYIEDEYPANNSIDICPCFAIIGVNISMTPDTNMSIEFLSNYTGNWETLEFLNITEVYSGWYYKVVNEFDIFNYIYYWRVNVTHNETYTVSDIYRLTTDSDINCCNTSVSIDVYTKTEADSLFLSGDLNIEPPLLFILFWVMLFLAFLYVESEEMTDYISIIFLPYTIFLSIVILPLYLTEIPTEWVWFIQFIFIAIAIFVVAYTFDVYEKYIKRK